MEHSHQSSRAVFRFLVLSLTASTVCHVSTVSAQEPATRPRRAEPPTFQTTDGQDVFFPNALQEGLRGTRPDHFGKPPTRRRDTTQSGTSSGDRSALDAATGSGWSRLISGVSIEDTVKATRLELNKSISQPAAFASGSNRSARRSFVMLTALFAIIAEYDGDVRWKSEALAARERCRNAAQICKVGSVQAYNAAKATRDEIADLIGGNSLPDGEASANKWDQLVDRGSLMQELQSLFDDLIQPAVANDASFQSQADEILVAAELCAAIAEVLVQEDMEDSSDDDYVGYCRRIQEAAKGIVEALQQNNGGEARSAAGEISQSCSECHETYRG